jgi:hypothetical protein
MLKKVIRLSLRLGYWIRSKRLDNLRVYKAEAEHKLVTIYAGNYSGTMITQGYIYQLNSQINQLEAEQKRVETELANLS